MSAFAKSSADDIFRTGPETLAAQTPVVVVGRAAQLGIEVEKAMQGESATPLAWTVRGVIDSGRTLKGKLRNQVIEFARRETSPFAAYEPPVPYWLADYGNLREGGDVVVFVSSAEPLAVSLVVPSGSGEQNLVALVAQASRIAALEGEESKRAAQLRWLHSAKTDAERRAALRSLVQARIEWNVLSAQLINLWSAWASTLREFMVGLIGYAIKEGVWPAGDTRPTQFMCRAFLQEQSPERQPIAMLPLKTLLTWTDEDGQQDGRTEIRDAVVDCLRQRRTAGPLGGQLQQQYEQLDPKFGVL